MKNNCVSSSVVVVTCLAMLSIFATPVATLAVTISDIETATGGTYLDFEFNTVGDAGRDGVDSRNGITATMTPTGGNTWAFDANINFNSAFTDPVLQTGFRSGSNPAADVFQVDITGLTPNTSYDVYVVHLDENDNNKAGFSWGTNSASLTDVTNVDGSNGGTAYSGAIKLNPTASPWVPYATPIGSFNAVGGSLTLHFDSNVNNESFLSGITVGVPEPTAGILAIIGLLCWGGALRPTRRV